MADIAFSSVYDLLSLLLSLFAKPDNFLGNMLSVLKFKENK